VNALLFIYGRRAKLIKKIIVILFIALIAGSAVIPALVHATETYTFVSAMYGSNSGQANFGSICNIGVDNSGDIYVIEFMGSSIKKFSSSFSPIPFTFTAGGTSLSFNQPTDIAFDSLDNIYISDYDTVRKFSKDGSLIATIGTWTIPNPLPGTPSVVHSQPGCIAVDSSFSVYVTAPFENKVYKFSLSGESYTSISWGNAFVAPSTANGKFDAPSGIAVYGGFVYVADSENQRIQKFTNTGTYDSQWSISTSTLPNKNPAELAIDSSGNIFVSFPFADCIQKFSSLGTLQATIGTPYGPDPGSSDLGKFYMPMGLAVDGSGNLYVADMGNNRLEKFTNSGTYVSVFYGQLPSTLSFNSAVNVVVDSLGNIFVVDFIGNSIKKFTSEYAPVTFTFGSTFNQPYGICLDGDGNIYVSDISAVRKFSNTGAFIATIGTWTGNQPGLICVDSSSNVYVTAPLENKVYKFSFNGVKYVELTSWGSFGSGNGQFNSPGGITAFGGYIYVADNQNLRIQKFSDTGVFQAAWSISALKPGLPNYNPTCLATDNSGNIFVTISFSSCVLKLSSSGVLLATIGTPHSGITTGGSAQGQFNQEKGIAVDADGYVYVADLGNSRIEKFSPPQSTPSSSDFFVFNSIPTPQVVGKPISISITAESSLGHTDTEFTGTATLTCSNGAIISPSVTGNFVNGYWEGNVVIDSPGYHIYLTATASDGTTGESINFNLIPALESTDASGTEKNTFSPVDTVYASGNGYPGSIVNVYVLIHQSNRASDDALIDVRGAPTAISLTSGAFNHAIVWVNPSPGLYDIVADTNGNGHYDALDAKDYADITPGGTGGFFVVPEYALAGLGALAASLVAFALFRTIRAPKTVP
jgi:sugar lactone lactonase YvrE